MIMMDGKEKLQRLLEPHAFDPRGKGSGMLGLHALPMQNGDDGKLDIAGWELKPHPLPLQKLLSGSGNKPGFPPITNGTVPESGPQIVPLHGTPSVEPPMSGRRLQDTPLQGFCGGSPITAGIGEPQLEPIQGLLK